MNFNYLVALLCCVGFTFAASSETRTDAQATGKSSGKPKSKYGKPLIIPKGVNPGKVKWKEWYISRVKGSVDGSRKLLIENAAKDSTGPVKNPIAELSAFLDFEAELAKASLPNLVDQSIDPYLSLYAAASLNPPSEKDLLKTPFANLAEFFTYVVMHGTTDATVEGAKATLGDKATPEHMEALNGLFASMQKRGALVEQLPPGLLEEYYNVMKDDILPKGPRDDVVLKRAIAMMSKLENIEAFIEQMNASIHAYEIFYCFVNSCKTMPEEKRTELSAMVSEKLYDAVEEQAEKAASVYGELIDLKQAEIDKFIKYCTYEDFAEYLKFLKDLVAGGTFSHTHHYKILPAFTLEHDQKIFQLHINASIIAKLHADKLKGLAAKMNFPMPAEDDEEGLFKLRLKIGTYVTTKDLKQLHDEQKAAEERSILPMLLILVVAVSGLVGGYVWIRKRKMSKIADLEAENGPRCDSDHMRNEGHLNKN